MAGKVTAGLVKSTGSQVYDYVTCGAFAFAFDRDQLRAQSSFQVWVTLPFTFFTNTTITRTTIITTTSVTIKQIAC